MVAPEPSVSLARFAAITARVDGGEARAQVLALARLSLDDWRAAQLAWLGRLAAEARQRRFALQQRYNQHYLDARAASDAGLPPALDRDDRAAKDPELASLLVGLPTVERDVALPFDAPSGPRAPRAEPRGDDPTVMPFRKKRPPRPAPPPEPEPDVSATLPDVPPIAREAALPFRAPSAKTTAIPAIARSDDMALPFRKPRPLADALPFKRTAKDPNAPKRVRSARRGHTMPFKAPPQDAGPPQLTLEQFASLSAELATKADDRAAIVRRYGLDEAMHDLEKQRWSQRFEADARENARYIELVREYRAWLARK